MRKRSFRQDISSQKFGKLTTIEFVGDSRWRCLCDCGEYAIVYTGNLKRGNTKSCGCVKRQESNRRATTHGLSKTKAYKSWCSIKKRCTNPKDPAFKSYGGKGILLCDAWLNDPKAFCEYIGEPESKDHTIDRIDNSKGYEPGNIRWASDIEQANNKTNNVKIEFQGQKFTSISHFIRWLAPQLNVNEKSLQRELVKNI